MKRIVLLLLLALPMAAEIKDPSKWKVGPGNTISPKNNRSVAIVTTVLTDQATPSAPASGKTLLYGKGGKACSLSPLGEENCTGGSGSSGVPYTGATDDVDLGAHKLSAGSIQAGDGTTGSQMQPACYYISSSGHAAGVVLPAATAVGASAGQPVYAYVCDGASYGDISTGGGVLQYWILSNGTTWAYAGQVQPDWNASSGLGQILNKPTLPATVTGTIFSGTATLATAAIASAACATEVSITATGVATTDAVIASFNGDPTAITGYIPATAGMLTIFVYPKSGAIGVKVCNNTGSSITPGSAVVINLKVVR